MANCGNRSRRCVFVGNIPYQASEEEVTKKCEEIGPVVSFRLMCDKETGKKKGFGFCEYMDEETALSAIRNLNGQDLRGRKLRVDFADSDKSSGRNRKNKGNSNSNEDEFGNDPWTQFLIRMPREKLIQIVSEMKKFAMENKEQARQLLLACPALPKALYQAQVMLGIVPPLTLQIQMPNSAAIPQFSTRSKSLDQCQLPVESIDSTRSHGSFLSEDHSSKRWKLNEGRAVSVSSSTDESSQDGSLIIRIDSVDNDHSSKRVKLEDGRAVSSSREEGSSVCGNRGVNMQFSAEEQSYMLQQVKNLTRGQISSLPPDEQQQVIQLQQMLIQQAY